MSIQGLDYWYDGQMRRFLEQIVRAFSGYQYATGRRNGQNPQLRMVPCRMASRDRLAAAIQRNNSENTLLTVPLITVDRRSLKGRREDVQSLTHVDTRLVTERAVDENGAYTNTVGNRYSVERLMPRPFEMSIQVDIWTSNMDQKDQLMEQILTVIYPNFEIQNSDNALDWTAKTMIEVEDIEWTSRSIPIGTENEIEVATITLRLPFWLTPPAKVTHQRIVDQIVTNINAGQVEEVVTNIDEGATRLAQNITTPGSHWVRVENGVVTLLGPEGAVHDPRGETYRWSDLLPLYGPLRPTQSTITLLSGDIEIGPQVIGTLEAGAEDNELFWTVDIDTLPGNDLQPVNAIIDPLRTWPGNGLPVAVNGQRYLVIHEVGNSQAWGTLHARENDIIQFSNGVWTVVFAAASTTTVKHVLNLSTTRQLRWTGADWVLSIDGDYGPGHWRLKM